MYIHVVFCSTSTVPGTKWYHGGTTGTMVPVVPPWYHLVPGTVLVEQKTTCIYTARTTISTKAKILRVHSI